MVIIKAVRKEQHTSQKTNITYTRMHTHTHTRVITTVPAAIEQGFVVTVSVEASRTQLSRSSKDWEHTYTNHRHVSL